MTARPPTYGEYWPLAAGRWNSLQLLSAQLNEVKIVARKLVNLKHRYEPIASLTGVPWYVIAVLHERESGCNFDRQLAQGDPLDQVAVHEPHCGPFASFSDSAVWALSHEGFDKVIDWRIEKILYHCEDWNGWGYWLYHPDVPSPYVYGATTIQKAGKYIGDGVWSATTWDTQLGCAALLYQMSRMDLTIRFARETHPGGVAPPIPRGKPPAVAEPWYRRFFNWLNR